MMQRCGLLLSESLVKEANDVTNLLILVSALDFISQRFCLTRRN